MANKPKLSVCVMTYNHRPYIEACLRSILDQKTSCEFEVIVGDDCSTDGSSAIIDEIARQDRRVRVPRPSSNIGITANLLAVHNAAQGEYVAAVDGDDLAGPGKFAAQIALLDQAPRLSLCGHRCAIIDENGTPTGNIYPARLPASFDVGKVIRCGLPVLASSIMYRAAARTERHADHELFDWFFYTDILRFGPGGYIPQVLGSYRVNSSSITAKLGMAGMIARMIELYRRRLPDLPQYKADFFGWAALMALGAVKIGIPITDAHRALLRSSATPAGFLALADSLHWALQNRRAAVR
jgi:glycosyltransferase involved in cell wall biosynthesis